ncbi:MAG: hypothetical protein ACRD0A_14560 [Acidimicrobiales bacterium]
MADVKVDYKDVWNSVTDVAQLLESNSSRNMGERAFVVPKGLEPWDLDWTHQTARHIVDSARRTSFFSRNMWCDETRVRVGVVWQAGGRNDGKGWFLHGAYMYAVTETTLAGDSPSASGKLSATPVTVGNGVAHLEGSAELDVRQFGMHDGSCCWDFWIRGDGSGQIQRR